MYFLKYTLKTLNYYQLQLFVRCRFAPSDRLHFLWHVEDARMLRFVAAKGGSTPGQSPAASSAEQPASVELASSTGQPASVMRSIGDVDRWLRADADASQQPQVQRIKGAWRGDYWFFYCRACRAKESNLWSRSINDKAETSSDVPTSEEDILYHAI